MRGAGDGKLVVPQVCVLAREEECLERLGGRPHERAEPGVAAGLDQAAVPDRGRVHAVARLDNASALHGYADWLHY